MALLSQLNSHRKYCPPVHYPKSRSVYITPLPIYAKVKDLTRVLSKYGVLDNLTLNVSDSGLYKCCSASFTEEKMARALINLKRIELYGRRSFIKAYHPKGGRKDIISYEVKGNNISNDAKTENNEQQEVSEPLSNQYGTSTVLIKETCTNSYDVDHSLCPYSVIRIGQLPSSWHAKSLFEHLTQYGLKIANVLIYDDIDELHHRQGLIEFEDIKDAAIACDQKFLRTSQLRLSVVRSVVANINDMRKSYNGAFTAFGMDDAILKAVHDGENTRISSKTVGTYSYSVAEPYEPNFGAVNDASISIQAAREQAVIDSVQSVPQSSMVVNWESSPDTLFSPQDDLYSPGNLAPITPLSEIGGDRLNQKKIMPKNTASKSAIRNGDTRFDTAAKVVGDHTVKCKSYLSRSIKCAESGGVFKSFRANTSSDAPYQGAPILKPSSTIIIDKLSQKFTPNARCLAMWMEQFGDVRAADLVPISDRFYRAYVSFFQPVNASNAYYNLTLGDMASYNLQARMA